ncbi:hypothetical protein BT93_E1989 [Corymbia citriodora subsp. variegata]|nr:hypothetical protein BT93_E1989 [Corymbia citriodora subsp. variegata]
MTNWEELPQEILELITCRLATEDFLDFGRVCTSWQSAATKETYKAKSKAPWLMTYMRKQTAEFFSPSRGRIFQLRASGVATIPLSRVSIELPFFERLRHKSPPTMELDEPKKLRHGPKRIHKIALSSSPSWSSHNFFSPGFSGSGTNIVCLSEIGRRCMDGNESSKPSASFSVEDADNQIMTLNERKDCMQLRLVLGQSFHGCGYLVECSGSLLVAGEIKGEGDAPVIRVFKLNAEDRESCFHGIKPNRIYFTDDMDEKKIYSMDDGTANGSNLSFELSRCEISFSIAALGRTTTNSIGVAPSPPLSHGPYMTRSMHRCVQIHL